MQTADRNSVWSWVIAANIVTLLACPALADRPWIQWAGPTNGHGGSFPSVVDVADNGAYVVSVQRRDVGMAWVRRYGATNDHLGDLNMSTGSDKYPGSAMWGTDGDFVSARKGLGLWARRFYHGSGSYGDETNLHDSAGSPISVDAWTNGNYVVYWSASMSAGGRRTGVTVRDAGNTQIVGVITFPAPDGRRDKDANQCPGDVAVTSGDRFVTLAAHAGSALGEPFSLYLAAHRVNGSALDTTSFVMASDVDNTGSTYQPFVHESGLAANETGLVIAAWYDDDNAFANACNIALNVYQLAAAPSTTLTAVTNLTANSMDGHNYAPDVAVDADGRFVVVWSHQGGTTAKGVYMRAFDENFQPLTDEVLVALPPDPDWTGMTMYPRVALSRTILSTSTTSDGYIGVVAWCSAGSGNYRVDTRRFVFAIPPRGTAILIR